jgi:hypothetical protein
MRRRGRTRRSYLVEAVLVATAVLVIYLWMTNGGPAAFGQWFADYMTQ